MNDNMTLAIKIWQMIGGRKFLAWMISSVFFAYGMLSEETWMWVTGFYIGANVAQKIGLGITEITAKRRYKEEYGDEADLDGSA
jgi:hypothetical protein